MTTLKDIGSGFNRSTINENFQTVEDELNNNVLKRDGVETGQDNSMKVDLDMNSKRILNLPAPSFPNDPVRAQDLPSFISDADSLVLVSNTETQTLSAGQTTVVLNEISTGQTAFYISGYSVDQGRLVPTQDYNVTNTTTIELVSSYPEGTLITAVQNEGTLDFESDVQVFDNIASMKSATLGAGDVALCKRYYSGGDLVEGLLYEIVASATVDGYVDHELDNGNFAVLINNGSVDLKQGGAKGDDSTNDITAINAVMDYASTNNSYVLVSSGTYLHSTKILVKNGVRGVLGQGGILKATTANGGLTLSGIFNGESVNVDNCDVLNLIIDGGGFAITAIEGQNTRYSNCEGNYIFNVVDGYGIMYRTYEVGARNTQFININNNIVMLNDNAYGVSRHAIAIDVLNADLNFSPYANELEYYNTLFTAATPTYFAENCSVTGNVTSGGYYGLSLVASQKVGATGNTFQNNTRNISIQHSAKENSIADNICIDSASSAIHLATGCKKNTITGNKIKNSANGGEASIQCYRNSAENLIANNQIEHTGSSGNQYFIYIGPKCHACNVDGNQLIGPVERGAIAVESQWSSSVVNQYSYAFGKTTDPSSDEDLLNVAIRNNYIDLQFVRPAIMLLAISEGGTDYDLVGTVVENNVIADNTAFRQLEITEEGSSLVRETVLTNNRFAEAATSSRFILPRGQAHFSVRFGNNRLDTQLDTFIDGDTTPSVGYGIGVYSCANTGATSITDFDNGKDGQEIKVRLDANTTIVHNSSLIRLKGSINIVGTTSNEIVSFQSISGIWFETGRNF